MSAGNYPPGEPGEESELREQAWIGDAVLGLYAREWIAQNSSKADDRSELFRRMTCNQFLSGLGEPTRVEAGIGRIYRAGGLNAAFKYIEENVLPLYLKQAAKRERASRGRK